MVTSRFPRATNVFKSAFFSNDHTANGCTDFAARLIDSGRLQLSRSKTLRSLQTQAALGHQLKLVLVVQFLLLGLHQRPASPGQFHPCCHTLCPAFPFARHLQSEA